MLINYNIKVKKLNNLYQANEIVAKPFLKWAGGKGQLIPIIQKAIPINCYSDKFTYIEPFVGSGAILFWMLNN